MQKPNPIPLPPSDPLTWSLVDLVDLEWQLALDAEVSAEDLWDRDRRISREQLVPVLGKDLVPEAGREIRSRGLRLWLEEVRKSCREESVGEMVCHGRGLMALILGFIAVTAGSGLVFGLLHREWRYFNVVHFLLATLAPQFLLLLLLLLGTVWGKFRSPSHRSTSLWRNLLADLWSKLATHAWTRRLSDVALRARTGKLGALVRPWLVWPVARLTQTAAIWYNLGIMGAFAGILLGMDVRFFWESTPGVSAEEGLHQVVATLATPWSWLAPQTVPSLSGIHDTRIAVTGTEGGWHEPEGVRSAEIWVPFLFTTLGIWGLLPRLILLAFCSWQERRMLLRQNFGDRQHRELWRRLAESGRLMVNVTGPGDDAIVLCWGGVEPNPEELRPVMLQQLRLNPVQWFTAGGLDVTTDSVAIRSLAKLAGEKSAAPLPLVLIAESWGLAPRDLAAFLTSLRKELGVSPSIRCLLIGEPKAGHILTPPKAEDLRIWEKFAADLGDGGFIIRPLRGIQA